MGDELLSIQLLDDFQVYGRFKEECLILLPGNKEFSILDLRSGLSTHHSTQNVLSAHRPKLLQVLEFANLHLDYPYLCENLLPYAKSYFNSTAIIDSVHWVKLDFLAPNTLQDIHADKHEDDVGVLEDGSVLVSSRDRLCTLTLSPHGRYFRVDFPLLCHPGRQGKYTYAWMRQIFSLHRFPPRWEYPLALALSARYGKQYDLPSMVQKIQEIIANNEYLTYQLFCSYLFLLTFTMHNTTFRVPPEAKNTIYTGSDVITALPMGDVLPASSRCYSIPPVSHLQLRFPVGKLVLLEWTPKATFQYFQKNEIIETVIFADDSVLVFYPNKVKADLGTFSHCENRVYHRTGVPNTIRLVEGQSYPLAPIAEHAIALHAHAAEVLRTYYPQHPNTLARERERESDSGYTNEIHKEGSEEGVGDFVAFKDGRIRGVFVDRTILDIQTRVENGKIIAVQSEMITNTGRKFVFGSVYPPEFSFYMHHAYQFALWAFGNQQVQKQIEEEQSLVDRIQMNLSISQSFLQSLDMLTIQGPANKQTSNTKNTPISYDLDEIQRNNVKYIEKLDEILKF